MGLIRQSCYASSRKSRSAFIGETLRGTWVHVSLDNWSKSTSHQKWHENWLQYIKLCTICGSWNVLSSTTLSSASSPSSAQESTSANRESVSENRDVETPLLGRSGGTSEEPRGDALHESTETEKIKWRIRRSTKRFSAWIARLASGIQREFGWWKYCNLGRPDAEECRHFQVIS